MNDVQSIPVDTRRRFNVYKTSILRRRRRIDVLQTLKRRRVSTGIVNNVQDIINDVQDIVNDIQDIVNDVQNTISDAQDIDNDVVLVSLSLIFNKSRASRSELFSKKDVLQNFKYSQFHNFTRVKSLFNKPECMLFYYKEALQHRCFPVNIAKFLRTPILKNIYKRLIQQISKFTLF